MATQDFVRSLRADGMEENEIRCQLRGAGYKTGRISQLLAATRASGSADLPLEHKAGRELEPHAFSVVSGQTESAGAFGKKKYET